MIRSFCLCEEQSLAEFSAQLGISRQNLSDVEHELRNVAPERAAEWARILGYDEGQFVGLAVEARLRAAGLSYNGYGRADRECEVCEETTEEAEGRIGRSETGRMFIDQRQSNGMNSLISKRLRPRDAVIAIEIIDKVPLLIE